MKKTVTYLFIVFLAALVFYGGAGVNLITYCCGDCRTEGVTALLENKCCEIHEHEHCTEMAKHVSSCCHADGKGGCCDVEHISFDWNVFQGVLLNLQPVAIDLISLAVPNLSLIPAFFMDEADAVEPDAPPGITPDVYLSLLTILLV